MFCVLKTLKDLDLGMKNLHRFLRTKSYETMGPFRNYNRLKGEC